MAKTAGFKYDDVMPSSRRALLHIRFENVTCGRRFFLSPFSKIPGYVWTSPDLMVFPKVFYRHYIN